MRTLRENEAERNKISGLKQSMEGGVHDGRSILIQEKENNSSKEKKLEKEKIKM